MLRLAGSRFVYRYLFLERERVSLLFLLVIVGDVGISPGWTLTVSTCIREPRPALAVQLWPSLLCRVRFSSSVWLVTSGLFLARLNEAARSFYFFIYLISNAAWRTPAGAAFIEWKPGAAAALSSMIENDGAISNGRRYTAACLSVGYSSRTLCVSDTCRCMQCGQSGGKTHATTSPHLLFFFRVYRPVNWFQPFSFLFLLGCPGEREGPDCMYIIAIVWFPHHLPPVCLWQRKTTDWLTFHSSTNRERSLALIR